MKMHVCIIGNLYDRFMKTKKSFEYIYHGNSMNNSQYNVIKIKKNPW